MARNKVRHDAGKGFESLRMLHASVALVNGTTIAVIGQVPAPIRIRRILYGSSVATDFSGNLDVLALANGADLDTAAGSTNQLISQVTAFADKKMHAGTLTSVAAGTIAADSPIVVTIGHNGILGTGLCDIIVEYDVVGTTYGAYDDGDSAGGTYV